MSEFFKSQRMRAAAWTALDPVLGSCELGFETDTYRAKIGNGITSWTLLPYMDEGSATATTKLLYGTSILAIKELTLKSSRAFQGNAFRQISDIARNFTSYTNALWDIREVGGSGVWLRQRFATVNDLYAFLDANAEAYPADPTRYRWGILGTCYDDVNSALPVIDKMYGQNTFLAMLKGRRAYRRSTPAVINPDWSSLGSWFEDLCTQDIGLPSGAAHAVGREQSVWLSRAAMRMYGMPRDNFATSASASTIRRWAYDDSTLTWNATTGTFAHSTSPPSGYEKLWCFLDTRNITNWTWKRTLKSSLDAAELAYYSGVCIYRLTNTTKHAVYLKPYGIDRVGLNWYDPAVYDLVALYECMDQTLRIRDISSPYRSNQLRDLSWVEKTQWFQLGHKPHFGINQTGNFAPVVRFALRDKATLALSPLSKMCLKMQVSPKDAPAKWLVEYE